MQNPYLISFWYDHYCQGYEDAHTTRLVYAKSYEDAVEKIKQNKTSYKNARDFQNLTIE